MADYTIDAVLLYIGRGIPVFPLSGKAPFKGTSGHKEATTDRETILAWAEEYPGCNWGMPTGLASGYDVLDIDGEEGRNSLDQWINTEHVIPRTPMQQTGSGGFHILFRAEGFVKNSVKAMMPGWDTRGEGGYIVIAPSVHPETGKPYFWLDGFAIEEVPPADWPDDLKALYLSKKADTTEFKPTDKIPHGQQEDTLTRYAGAMVRNRFSPEEILAALTVMGQTRCDPPMPVKNIERIAESISRRPPGDFLEVIEQTDRGWGMRFGEFGKNGARFVVDEKEWAAWDGQRWKRENPLGAQRMFDQMVDTMIAYGLNMPDGVDEASVEAQRKNAFLHYAREGRSNGGFDKTLKHAPRFSQASLTDFDTNPFYFNTQNGTVDLRTGVLRPHDPADLITRISPVRYNPQARSEVWEDFLNTVTLSDPLYQQYLQRHVGYTMFGKADEQLMLIILGAAATGKSTFINAVKKVFGEYAEVASTNAFAKQMDTSGGKPRPEIAKLRGARMVSSVETGRGQEFDEVLIKSITGNEEISVRTLHKTEFTFLPQFTIWIATNDEPKNSGSSAMFRRLKIVPFENVIPEGKRDRDLSEKLMLPENAEGILAWCVQGAIDYLQFGLPTHWRVDQATKDFQEDSDVVGQWMNLLCEETEEKDEWVTRDAAWQSWKIWCSAQDLDAGNKGDLYGGIRDHGYKDAKRGSTPATQERVFKGLRLRETAASAANANVSDAFMKRMGGL